MLFRLVRRHVAKHKFLGALVCGGLFLAMIFCFMMMAMYRNAYHFYADKSGAQGLGAGSFVLTANPAIATGLAARELHTGVLQELASVSGLDNMYAFYTVHVPTSVDISYLGLGLRTDMQLYAVSDNYFLDQQASLSGVALSQQLIDIYNLSLGGTSRLYPEVNQGLLRQISLDFVIGQSSFFSYNNQVELQEFISFVDTTVPLLGVTFPLSKITAIIDELDRGYISLYKVVGTFSSAQNFDVFLQEFGDRYSISYPEQRLQKIQNDLTALKVLLIVMSAFVIVIVVFFMIYVIASLLHKHKRLFFIFQSIGAHYSKGLLFLLGEITLYWLIASMSAILLFVTLEQGVFASVFYEYFSLHYTSLALYDYIVLWFCFALLLILCILGLYWGQHGGED